MASLGRFVLLEAIAVAAIASCTLDFDEPFGSPQSDAGLDGNINKEGGFGGHAGNAASGGVAGKGGKGGASGAAGGKGGTGGSGGKGGVGGAGGVGGGAAGVGAQGGYGGIGGQGGNVGGQGGNVGGQGGNVGGQGGDVGGQGGANTGGQGGYGGVNKGGGYGGVGGQGGITAGGQGGSGYGGNDIGGSSGVGGWIVGGSGGIGGQGGGGPGPCQSDCGSFCSSGKASAACSSCWNQECPTEWNHYQSDTNYQAFEKCVEGCTGGPQCVDTTCCAAHPATCAAWFSVWSCSCGYINSSCGSSCDQLCMAFVLTSECISCATLSPCSSAVYDYLSAPEHDVLDGCIQGCAGNPTCTMYCCQAHPQACTAWQALGQCTCNGG